MTYYTTRVKKKHVPSGAPRVRYKDEIRDREKHRISLSGLQEKPLSHGMPIKQFSFLAV